MLSKCDNIRFYAYKIWSASLFLLLYMYSVSYIFKFKQMTVFIILWVIE